MEKEDWKSFRNALDKSDRKKFDEMFGILVEHGKKRLERVGFEQ